MRPSASISPFNLSPSRFAYASSSSLLLASSPWHRSQNATKALRFLREGRTFAGRMSRRALISAGGKVQPSQ
ncbi:MAG: hypothetical protein L6R35_001090, partial [Caloplaca aegaea]